jgi:hypothetical protein
MDYSNDDSAIRPLSAMELDLVTGGDNNVPLVPVVASTINAYLFTHGVTSDKLLGPAKQ